MIEIMDIDDDRIVGWRVDGRIDKADIDRIYSELARVTKDGGKVRMYIETGDFHLTDVSKEAMWEDLSSAFKHPRVVSRIEKIALVSDQVWVKGMMDIELALIPTMSGANFMPHQKERALMWLKSDQGSPSLLGLPSHMDLSRTEVINLGALKAAGGFAVGLIAGAGMGRKQGKIIGFAVLLGVLAVGLPWGIGLLDREENR